MDGSGRERFQASIAHAHGAVLVTGPTGSGKSTTLYAALDELNAVEKKIITIEDPVEYRIDGINQMNVNRKAGLTFAAGLRSMLRADPDIIMVGEIRDARDRADRDRVGADRPHGAVDPAHQRRAGHDHAPAKMGIESFLTASALDCVVAQRLARKLCTALQEAHGDLRRPRCCEAGFRVGADLEAYEPVGCARCNNTGFKGRIGLFSVMQMSERIKDLTVERRPGGRDHRRSRARRAC